MKLNGIYTAVITPFTGNGALLDEKAFRKIILSLKNAGTKGVIVTGSTGEAATLTTQERMQLWSWALDYRSNNFQVWAGTGTNDTRTTWELSEEAKSVGVDGILVVSPYYNKPTPEGLFEHFSLIASTIDIPICLYEVPSRTAQSIPTAVIKELTLRHKNIVAVKESSADLLRISYLRKNARKGFQILSGDDPNFLMAKALGADGLISVAAHLWPKDFIKLNAFMDDGDLSSARRIHEGLLPRMQKLFSIVNPLGVKTCLAHQKKCELRFRLPLTNPSTEERKNILKALR